TCLHRTACPLIDPHPPDPPYRRTAEPLNRRTVGGTADLAVGRIRPARAPGPGRPSHAHPVAAT
ncbi:hypothetical protein O3Q52_32875, partial [Streptomyces sp. ActVer]|uniref:hypothetical protein n=1 Tax=Streptomyces sp. ActVer TaxID=3014558 RepID=UPI0022B489F6